MKTLLELLTKQNLTLASCESLTGGLFGAVFTESAGISRIFKGSLVVYSQEAKIKLAQVSSSTLEKYGTISAECAEEMAKNTQQLLKVDVAISFTGNAGPTAQENKPVGLVYIGLAIKDNIISKEYQFSGSRKEIRQHAVETGIRLIKDYILEK